MCLYSRLYLIEILHQTTTSPASSVMLLGCILSKFYIKPQRESFPPRRSRVVSYRNSTSNHNTTGAPQGETGLYLIEILHQTTTVELHYNTLERLYLIEILHQTTTMSQNLMKKRKLYLIEILHQTTTDSASYTFSATLYLIEILHQTTTVTWFTIRFICCILSKFYIKPQRRASY